MLTFVWSHPKSSCLGASPGRGSFIPYTVLHTYVPVVNQPTNSPCSVNKTMYMPCVQICTDSRATRRLMMCKAHLVMGSSHLGHKPLKVSKDTRRLRYPGMAKHLLGQRDAFDYLHPEHHHTRILRAVHVLCDVLLKGGTVLVVSHSTANQPPALGGAKVGSPLRERVGSFPRPNPYRVLVENFDKTRTKDWSLPRKLAEINTPSIRSTGVSNSLNQEIQSGSTKGISYNPKLIINEHRWLCGFLSNWQQTGKTVWRVSNFSQRLDAFTKTDHITFPRYRQKEKSFKGFVSHNSRHLCLSFRSKPDLVLVLDALENISLVREAAALKVPVITVADSNVDLTGILYPLPANSESIHLLTQFINLISQCSTRYKDITHRA